MPDLSKVLDDSYASYARGSARPSDVDVLIRRGAVRRRRSQVRIVTSTVLVIAVIVGAGVLGFAGSESDDQRPAPAPAPTPSPELELKDMTAEQIVHHEDARLENLAVSEADDGTRASVWSLCRNDACRQRRYAVAVTRNGFKATEYVPIDGRRYPDLQPLMFNSFLLRADGRTSVLQPDGTLRQVTRARESRPMEAGESIVSGGFRSLAISPPDASTHVVPSRGRGIMQQGDSTLVGTDLERAYWSADGGATWESHDLEGPTGALFQPIESSDADTIALVEGADGATLMPVVAFHVSRDGGATWERVEAPAPGGETGYLSWAVVRPDGSLMIQFEAWSDDRLRKPSKRSRGPYESDGADCSSLTPVSPGLPGNDRAAYRQLQSVTHSGNDVRLYVSQVAQAYVSADGGNTWDETAAR